MKIPPGHTEQSVLEAIEKAVALLAPSFTFGYFDLDDVKQEARVMAIEVLNKERYNPAMPLPPFLYTHLRNRLVNLRRNKLRRNDSPCDLCHKGSGCGPDGQQCDRYKQWKERNAAKAAIMCAGDLDNVPDEHEKTTRVNSDVLRETAVKELLTKIDQHLPVDLRASFLQMKAGVILPKARREQVEKAVRDILGDALEEHE